LDLGQLEEAEQFLAEAAAISGRVRARALMAQVDLARAAVALERSEPAEAEVHAKAALDYGVSERVPWVEVRARMLLALAALSQSTVDRALEESAAAVVQMEKIGPGRLRPEAIWLGRFRVLAAAGDMMEAAEALSKGRAVVQAYADILADRRLARSYLKQVPTVRQILAFSANPDAPAR
jgi:hypothetical protein